MSQTVEECSQTYILNGTHRSILSLFCAPHNFTSNPTTHSPLHTTCGSSLRLLSLLLSWFCPPLKPSPRAQETGWRREDLVPPDTTPMPTVAATFAPRATTAPTVGASPSAAPVNTTPTTARLLFVPIVLLATTNPTKGKRAAFLPPKEHTSPIQVLRLTS